jgi:hypothetical protein
VLKLLIRFEQCCLRCVCVCVCVCTYYVLVCGCVHSCGCGGTTCGVSE